MGYWIDRLGFWGYLKAYPLNPITIVGDADYADNLRIRVVSK